MLPCCSQSAIVYYESLPTGVAHTSPGDEHFSEALNDVWAVKSLHHHLQHHRYALSHEQPAYAQAYGMQHTGQVVLQTCWYHALRIKLFCKHAKCGLYCVARCMRYSLLRSLPYKLLLEAPCHQAGPLTESHLLFRPSCHMSVHSTASSQQTDTERIGSLMVDEILSVGRLGDKAAETGNLTVLSCRLSLLAILRSTPLSTKPIQILGIVVWTVSLPSGVLWSHGSGCCWCCNPKIMVSHGNLRSDHHK